MDRVSGRTTAEDNSNGKGDTLQYPMHLSLYSSPFNRHTIEALRIKLRLRSPPRGRPYRCVMLKIQLFVQSEVFSSPTVGSFWKDNEYKFVSVPWLTGEQR